MGDFDGARAREFVRLDVADGVATIRLDRPKMNALNVQVQEEIRSAAAEATERDDISAVVVYGGERVFAAGADVKEMADMSYTDMVKRSGGLQSAFTAVARIPKPVVAAVTGYALGGGCELALSCDLIVASEDAVFGLPETGVGILPGGGGTQLLTRKVGTSRAKEIVLAGRRLSAAEAADWGLVARVAPRAELGAATMELAAQICRASPVGVREAKQAIDRAFDVPLPVGIELEDLAWRRTVASRDRTEGIAAFNEKREPRWENR
jgi:enoyl-CoA hydratase/carnithine racemase